MTQKVFNLVKGILTGCEAIAIAIVTFTLSPAQATPINAAIVIGVKAAEEICAKFVTDETKQVE